ncbi:MAG TPA: class I SAM-dependent methyltransferase [Clostridia bacterium]|nr:class I SAM-dependent methyltransferase [Clostridia bacterium]
MTASNINTRDYWNSIYRAEIGSNQQAGHSHRDYAPIHDAIIRLVPPHASVLDIACGPGLLCRKIRQRVPTARVLGVDFSEVMVRHNQLRDASLGVQYQCLDIRDSLASLDEQFDVIAMCEILEHLERPEKTVESALELLRPGGRFILSCPHDDAIPDPEHLRTWGHDDIFHLLAPYSETVSFVHFPPPYFHIWMMAYLTKMNMTAYLEHHQ